MRMVSDTSPISNLAIIQRLDLLRERYGHILIPREVAAELNRLNLRGALQSIERARETGWLKVEIPSGIPPIRIQPPLHVGEAAAITLAWDLKADHLLIDERLGREAARRLGLKVSGVLGELLYAKSTGSISSVRREMERLRSDARFFIDPEIERFILNAAKE